MVTGPASPCDQGQSAVELTMATTKSETIESRLGRCQHELEQIHRDETEKVDERTKLVWEARDDHGLSLNQIGAALGKPGWFAAKLLARPYPEH
jgi:hypothetical protein